eukprot:4856104-Pyramimonas_sp.AAC.1
MPPLHRPRARHPSSASRRCQSSTSAARPALDRQLQPGIYRRRATTSARQHIRTRIWPFACNPHAKVAART